MASIADEMKNIRAAVAFFPTMKRNLLTIILALVAGLAFAQGGGAHDHAKHDIQPRKMLSFDDLDANHDGKITRDEFRDAQEKIAQRMFAKFDLNHDGQISREEFDKAKLNVGGQNSDEQEHPRSFGPAFAALDKDGSGTISRDEFMNAMLDQAMKRFDRMDKNGDGVITRDEMESSIRAVGGKHDLFQAQQHGAAPAKPPEPPAGPNGPIVSDK